MKKEIFVLVLIFTFINCSSNDQKVERIIEDGIEVIINHMEPSGIKGESLNLTLEKELIIDLENKEFEDLGLAHPEHIDADSEGNLYLVDRTQSLEYFIYKFDKQGNFIDSIGRRGQGPGEIPNLTFMGLNAQDKIWISSWGGRKIVVLDKNGTFLTEKKYPTRWQAVIPLENGNYLAMETVFDETKGSAFYHLILYNSGFEEIKRIDFFDWSYNLPGKKRAVKIPLFDWRVKNGKIYVGNEHRGYEIWVYDLDGNLLRKIRKEYNPVKYPEEFKKKVDEMAKRRPDIYSLDYCPPFNSFFIDDDNRLYVMTYEQAENKEEYIYDIFNEDGIFYGRKSIGLTYVIGQALNRRRAQAKNNRYYRIRYKENGYVELIVYKMIWE